MYYALIMAGGSGTRLWPLSRQNRPKQALKLIGQRTMFQHAVDRIIQDSVFSLLLRKLNRRVVLSGVEHDSLHLASRHLSALGGEAVLVPARADGRVDPERVLAAGDERDRLWQRWVAVDPRIDAYSGLRSTETPVVVLEPRDGTAA